MSLLQKSAGRVLRSEGDREFERQVWLCLDGHKRHKSWNRQVSNLIEESGFPERGSPSNGHKKHKNAMGQDWEPYFVTFVLFVVEPFTPFTRQRGAFRGEVGGEFARS